MKKYFLLFLVFAIACSNEIEENEIPFNTTSSMPITQSEYAKLCELGYSENEVFLKGNYIATNKDYAINRKGLNELIKKNRGKSLSIGKDYVPEIGDVEDISVYVHQSFLDQNSDWQNGLDSAISILNCLEHSRISFNTNGTYSSNDIILVIDSTSDESIDPCFIDILPGGGQADFPINEQIGKYVSINDNTLPTNEKIAKLLLHEFSHTLGIDHNCLPMPLDTTCTGAIIDHDIIETTFVQNLGSCDSTSLMYTATNGYTTNHTISGTSVCATNGDFPSEWMNENDIFVYQAMFPESYLPFAFSISSCEQSNLVKPGQHYPPYNLKYNLTFSQNDFVPYKIEYFLIDEDEEIVQDTVSYRYWPSNVEFLDVQHQDVLYECFKLRIKLSNYKEDYSNSAESSNCCSIL